MRIVSIVGARPQFVKLAPVSRAMANATPASGGPLEDIIVHTGQHYDAALSSVFFDELQIPKPTVNLDIGSGQRGEQTAKMITAIEQILVETDSPVEYQGKVSEPADLTITLRELSRVKAMPTEEVRRITTSNARRFFGI